MPNPPHLILLTLLPILLAAAPATQPQTRDVTIPRTTVTFKLVRLPPGSIDMPPLKEGDKPRTIEIKPFWIGQTELTWDELQIWAFRLDLATYQERIDAIGRTHPSLGMAHYAWGSDPTTARQSGYPAVALASHAAQVYSQWLSKLTARRFRLPTEAEWEYACRAGASTPIDPQTLNQIAWYLDNSANQGTPQQHPVASKKPNAWGLYDMLGNVAEWVTTDADPVVKGGSYKSPASQVHARARQPYHPDWQLLDPEQPKNKWLLSNAPFIGFRLVMDDQESTP